MAVEGGVVEAPRASSEPCWSAAAGSGGPGASYAAGGHSHRAHGDTSAIGGGVPGQ